MSNLFWAEPPFNNNIKYFNTFNKTVVPLVFGDYVFLDMFTFVFLSLFVRGWRVCVWSVKLYQAQPGNRGSLLECLCPLFSSEQTRLLPLLMTSWMMTWTLTSSPWILVLLQVPPLQDLLLRYWLHPCVRNSLLQPITGWDHTMKRRIMRKRALQNHHPTRR